MPDYRRTRCRNCRGHETQVGDISWGGYCRPCGKALENENVDQMVARSGPNFDRWRRSMVACVGGVLLDETRATP